VCEARPHPQKKGTPKERERKERNLPKGVRESIEGFDKKTRLSELEYQIRPKQEKGKKTQKEGGGAGGKTPAPIPKEKRMEVTKKKT